MNSRLTSLFVLPFLFSTAIPAKAQSSLLDKNTALQTVAARILNDSQYSNVQMKCLSFVTVNSNTSFFDFIVHEKHGAGCPSVGNSKLIFERFRINRDTSRVEQFDKVANRWMAENKVQLKKIAKKEKESSPYLFPEIKVYPYAMIQASTGDGSKGKAAKAAAAFAQTQQDSRYGEASQWPYGLALWQNDQFAEAKTVIGEITENEGHSYREIAQKWMAAMIK